MSYGTPFQLSLYYVSPAVIKNLLTSLNGYRQKRLRQRSMYRSFFSRIDAAQWDRGDVVEADTLAKVKDSCLRAEAHCQYWKTVFAASGFSARHLTTLADLKRLPILSKEPLRENLAGIMSDDRSSMALRWVNTSGTTGLGLKLPETIECFNREYAFRFHNYSCGGIAVGDRWAFCAGHPVADLRRTRPPFWSYDHVNNWLIMSSYHLTEKNMRTYVDELAKFDPAMIGGYPSSVYLLAIANEYFGKRVRPRAVYTASETLFDFQREAIERSFGCKAYTYYGNAERAGFIAECEKGSLHVKPDHSFVEVLDDRGNDAGPGKPGRMVVTTFGNRALPLIRYDVGDIVVRSHSGSCPCGRAGTLLQSIVGRTEDYVLTPDGRFVGRLDHLFKEAPRVRTAQIVQERLDRVRLRIVREEGYGPQDEEIIRREARYRLGDAVAVEFEYVNDIPRTKGGKHRFVVSTIKNKELFGKKLPDIG
jgi:phenylacetate-CoA ligase